MVGSSCTDDRLSSINWQNQSIKFLGFQIGNVNPRAIWHDSLEGLRKQKMLINVPFQSWQAKSLPAKSKLLPQITYNAHTYPLDTTTRNMIETEFLNYLTNNPTISLSMRSFIPLHPTTSHFNYIPHRDHLTPYYQKTIQILKEYKISHQKSTKGEIRQIYNQLSYSDKPPSRQKTFHCKLVTSSILPRYLKTFNCRTVRNILPFSPEPDECALCLQFQDTAVHVFAKCSTTRQIWINLQEVFNVFTQTTFPLDNLTPLNFQIPTQFENFTETIALLLTATNYCIW